MPRMRVLVVLLLLLSACKKEITSLPPATETGADTFGARVDSSFFVPQGLGSIHDDNLLKARYPLATHNLTINARNIASTPNEKEFEIFLANVTTPGTYLLNTPTSQGSLGANYGYYVKRNVTPQNEWMTNASYTGSVTITRLDTINNIVSGTFQFNAINLYNSPQPISVTDGRFDIRLNR